MGKRVRQRFLLSSAGVVVAALTVSSCLLFDFGGRDTVPIARPDIDVAGLEGCTEIEDAVTRELHYIRYCLADAQCGEPLQGTSCGCTRDLVARRDASSDRFYDLLDLAVSEQCSLDMFVSTCDCPAVSGFSCVARTCQWDYSADSQAAGRQ